MKVPVNPQTRVPQGQLGYGKNHDVSSGIRALGQVVSEYAKELQVEDKKRELFDVQRMIVDETNALQIDFDKKSSIEVLGAPNFTQRVNSEYNTRHEQMAQGLRDRGYSEDAVQELGTRLGTVRSTYVAKAIGFQNTSRYAKVLGDTKEMATSLSQYVTENPDNSAVTSSLDELKVGLTHSDLDAVEQQKAYEEGKAVILLGARQGYARKYADQVIGMFDPESPDAPAGASTGEVVGVGNHEKPVVDGFTSAGFRPVVIAGFLGNFKIEAGYTRAKGDGGDAEGIAQWNRVASPDRVANFLSVVGKPIGKATVAEQMKFVIWEMQNPGEAGMSVEGRDAILNAKTAEEAARLIDKHYERSDGSARSQREAAAKLYFKTMGKADATVATLGTTEPSGVDAKGKTGIAIIDLSTGPERMQMLAWAKSSKSDNSANERAGIEVDHQNAVNAYMTTGTHQGAQRSAEDYTRIYGPVVGPQKFAEVENAKEVGADIQQFKTQSPQEIETAVEILRPKDTSSTTYTTDLQAYERAQQAAVATLKAREDNPAGYLFSTFPNVTKQLQVANDPEARRTAYVAVNEAYKKIGIPPEKRVMMSAEQAKGLQEKYSAIPAGQKIRQLDQWNNELGPLYDPFMRQLATNSYDAGEDSVMWSILKRHPQGFSTMSQILEGQKIMQEDPARRPGADVINVNFKDSFGSAISSLNPAASKIYNGAASAIYVAKGGRTDSQQFDADLYEESLRLAVGGLPGVKTSGIVNMTQGQVKDWTILPLRTTEEQFTNWLERLTPGTLERMSLEKSPPVYRTGNRVPLDDIIDEGVFVLVAPNVYKIKMASDGGTLKTASESNFMVRIVPGEPVNLPRVNREQGPKSNLGVAAAAGKVGR